MMNKESMGLNRLYRDYSEGEGDRGPVLREFSDVMQQYKEDWNKWKPFHAENIEVYVERPDKEYRKRMIFDAIIAAGILVLHFLLPGNQGWLIIAVIAGIVMGVKSKDSIWGWLIGLLSFIVFFVAAIMKWNASPVFYVFLYAMVALNAGQAFSKMKEEEKKMAQLHQINTEKVRVKKQLEQRLDENRDKLFSLMPDLQNEYDALYQIFVKRNTDIDAEIRKRCQKLPDKFWWEVSPDMLFQWEKTLANGRNEDDFSRTWEIRAVERPYGEEFQYAGYEYSPLESDELTETQLNEIYQKKKAVAKGNSAKILDFIGVVVQSSIGEETVSYVDYQYSSIQRLSKTMEWDSIGSNIRKSYTDGELSESDYDYLVSKYQDLSPRVHSEINKQIEKQYEREKEIKTATFFWSGQAILTPDPSADGYILTCYHCQFQHMFENLEALRKYNITRVQDNGDQSMVTFLAKIHQIYPRCR